MLIDTKTREFLIKKFNQELKEDVDISLYTRNIILKDENPEYAQFSKEFIKELSQLNSKIKVKYLSPGSEIVKRLNLSLSPTILIGKNNGYSIQYWGAPAGQISSTLIETISLVSQRKSGLKNSLREKLKNIDKNILIETYFSFDSPASSQAVLLSNQISVELPDKVISRSVESEEAIERVKNFNIYALPSVIINENKDSLAEIEEEEKKKKMLINNPDYPIVLDTPNFDQAIKKYPFLVIDCWAEWCAPCLMVHPIIENLARQYKGKITFAKLNIDHNKEIAGRFGIMSIPTLLVFRDGQNIESIIGALPQDALEKKLISYL